MRFDWRITRDNAVEKLETAKVLIEHCHLTSAYEAAFFASEIVIKAWVLRHDQRVLGLNPKKREDRLHPWFGHNLTKLLKHYQGLDLALRQGCHAEYRLLHAMARDADGWKPWHRYHRRADLELAQNYTKVAEGLQKWMIPNLLQD